MTAQDLITEAREWTEYCDHALSTTEIALVFKSNQLKLALADALEAAIKVIEELASGAEPCEVCRSERNCHKLASCPSKGYNGFDWRDAGG